MSKKPYRMKISKLNLVIAAVIVWFIIALFGISHLLKETVSEKEKQEETMKKMKRKINYLESEIDDLNSEKDDLESRIDDLE